VNSLVGVGSLFVCLFQLRDTDKVCKETDFFAAALRYDEFLDKAKKLHPSDNLHLRHLSEAIHCLKVAADILLEYSCDQSEALLSKIFAKYGLSDKTSYRKLCDVRCGGFFSLSFIDHSADRSMSDCIGFNIFSLRKELEHRYTEILGESFKFRHIFHFLAVSVINRHFVPTMNLDPSQSSSYISVEFNSYGCVGITERFSYQFISIVFVQHLIGIGIELESEYQQTSADA